MKRPCVGARCRGYCFGPLPRAPERPGPGLSRGGKLSKKYESRHLKLTISGGRLFFEEKGGLGAPGPLPLVFSLWWHVARVPFSFSFVSTSFAAGAAARAFAAQTHFNPEAVQFAVALESLHRRSRALRRQMHAKRLMHDDAAVIYWQDTRPSHREESSEPSAASHGAKATPPRSDVARRPLLETRALSSEPSKVFIPGAECFAGACVRSTPHVMVASSQCDTGGGWVKVLVCAKSWGGAVSCCGLRASCLPKPRKGRCT